MTAVALPSDQRVLVVEDDPALRAILASLLTEHGLAAREAENRPAALAVLRADPEIAVVILDLGLPPAPHATIEGIALLEQMQAGALSAKVIVLSGQDQEIASFEAIRSGAFDFLAKPAATADILRAVRRAVLFADKEHLMRRQGLSRLAINIQVAAGVKAAREETEKRLVRQVLRDTGFNIRQSAVRLGIKREYMYYLLNKFKIRRDA